MIESAFFQEKETRVTIISEPEFIRIAKSSILTHRNELESFIHEDPFFKITYEPYACPGDAPEIVKRMCAASKEAGVGPMAAVAGAIAELAVEAMIEAGATHAIVENGGDIAMVVDRPVIVAVYTGESEIRNIGFRIVPEGGPVGICTSSGVIGHSVSLGNSYASTVYAQSASYADAFATALGNIIKDDNKEKIERTIARFKMEHIYGIMVITRGHIAMCGRLPELIRLRNRGEHNRVSFFLPTKRYIRGADAYFQDEKGKNSQERVHPGS